MIKIIKVFCRNESCEKDSANAFDLILPLADVMEIGSACHSEQFFVPVVCAPCGIVETKNIVGRKYVRCSDCKKKMSLLGTFHENQEEDNNDCFRDMVPFQQVVELEPYDENGRAPQSNIAESGSRFRLPLRGHTCPRCSEQTLSFRTV